MKKTQILVPLFFLFGFSLWGAFRGLEAIRTRGHDFNYSGGPKMRPAAYSRSMRFEGAEAVRVGCAMTALSLSGFLWLAALCRPSPSGTVFVHQGLARAAFALYIISILVFLPPWRLSSAPLIVFYGVHVILFGCWKFFQRIDNPDRQKQFAGLAALSFMLGVPALEINALRFGGADFGHDLGLAAGVAVVSAVFTAGQLALLNLEVG